MTPADYVRNRISQAQWHLAEYFLQVAVGAYETAEYHLDAAREYVEILTGQSAASADPSDLTAAIETAKETVDQRLRNVGQPSDA